MKEKFLSFVSSLFVLTAATGEAGEPSWAERFTMEGDFRSRYETVEVDGEVSKSRMRLRARVGLRAEVNEEVHAGIRLATGADESPTSANQTIEDFGNKRATWMDLAYMAYEPAALENLDVLLGKMKKPWESVSNLMYDGDVNPEGVNLQYVFAEDLTITANLGCFLWQDAVQGDPETDVLMPAGQVVVHAPVSENVKLALGAAAFFYTNIEDADIPTVESDQGSTTVTDANGEEQSVRIVDTKPLNRGNSMDEDGTWTYGYELIEAFAKIDLKSDLLAWRLYLDYILNVASDVEDDRATLVGARIGYKGSSLDYNYRDVERDAILGLLADGALAGSGTGVSGHTFKLKTPLFEPCSLGVAYFIGENVDGRDVDTVQIDVSIKF